MVWVWKTLKNMKKTWFCCTCTKFSSISIVGSSYHVCCTLLHSKWRKHSKEHNLCSALAETTMCSCDNIIGQIKKNIVTLYFPVSSAENHCKQFGPRSGLTFCQAWSGSNLFDIMIVFLKVHLKKISRPQKVGKFFPCNEIILANTRNCSTPFVYTGHINGH